MGDKEDIKELMDSKMESFKEILNLTVTQIREEVKALKEFVSDYIQNHDGSHKELKEEFEKRISALENRIEKIEGKDKTLVDKVKESFISFIVPGLIVGFIIWASHGFIMPLEK